MGANCEQNAQDHAWHTVSPQEMLWKCVWKCDIIGKECEIHMVVEALNGGHQCLDLIQQKTRGLVILPQERQDEHDVQGRGIWQLTGPLN